MVKHGDIVEWELKRFGTQRGVVIGGEREGSERWRIKKDDGTTKFVLKDKITRVVPEKKKTVEEPSSVPKKKKTVVKNKKQRKIMGEVVSNEEFRRQQKARYDAMTPTQLYDAVGPRGEIDPLTGMRPPDPHPELSSEDKEMKYKLKYFFGIDWTDFSNEGRDKLTQVLIADKQRRIDELKKEKKQNVENVKDLQSKIMAGDLDLEAKEWYDPQTGAEYMQVWDDRNNRWLISNPEIGEEIGYLDKQGKLIKI